MIKLKNIITENYFSIYYWMDPTGEFHKVDNEEHAPWASEYLTTHNLPILVPGSIYRTMYKMGWVRVGLVGYLGRRIVGYNYEKERPLPPRTLRYLKDFAIERGADEMRDDTSGRTIDLDVAINEDVVNETMSYKELLAASEKGRKQRSSDVSVRNLPVSTESNAEAWNFRYSSNPSTTGKSWKGYISF